MVFVKGHKSGMTNKHHTEEAKRKIGLANKSKIPWNKGKTGVYSEEQRKNMSEGRKGMKFSEEHRLHLSIIKKGKPLNHDGGFKKGHIPWNKGKEVPQIQGEKSPHWNGGSSKFPYGFEFNSRLKRKIRKRDQYRCQQCFRHQNELKCPLAVHHIDYNKKNNNPKNLISLCNSCHSQTNFKRTDWSKYFENRLTEAGNNGNFSFNE